MDKIAILMSTFNGERYIDEQIESILFQENVCTHIWIRDDGSTDTTVEKIQKWKEKVPDRIFVFSEENVGYRGSFLKLLAMVSDEYDYYGFSDQDDVWHKDKCARAIQKLEAVSGSLKLYTSNLNIVDEHLNHISKTDIEKNYHMTLYSYWIRARFAGCTYVFSKALKIKAMGYTGYTSIDHDFLLGTLAFVYGKVVFDSNASIEHRRSAQSVTSGGKGIADRIKTEFNHLFRKNGARYFLAAKILEKEGDKLPAAEREFFLDVAHYRNSLRGKLKLLCNKEFASGVHVFDAMTKVKVLLSNY